MTGHLLDAGKRWAGDLVAAESGVDADKNAGLSHEVSVKVEASPIAEILTSLLL
jgi:hypothetical protein